MQKKNRGLRGDLAAGPPLVDARKELVLVVGATKMAIQPDFPTSNNTENTVLPGTNRTARRPSPQQRKKGKGPYLIVSGLMGERSWNKVDDFQVLYDEVETTISMQDPDPLSSAQLKREDTAEEGAPQHYVH